MGVFLEFKYNLEMRSTILILKKFVESMWYGVAFVNMLVWCLEEKKEFSFFLLLQKYENEIIAKLKVSQIC